MTPTDKSKPAKDGVVYPVHYVCPACGSSDTWGKMAPPVTVLGVTFHCVGQPQVQITETPTILTSTIPGRLFADDRCKNCGDIYTTMVALVRVPVQVQRNGPPPPGGNNHGSLPFGFGGG